MLTLDPLTAWCGEVLQRGVDGTGSPAVDTVPPLPHRLRDPLLRSGFDAFDEAVIALSLAPDLDPVLAAAVGALSGRPATRHLTLAVLADLVGAQGAERVTLATRLSDGGPLARMGLVHIVPSPDSPVVGEPARGPSMLASCLASTALLRWVFGITQLEPALHPLVRDDLLAPSTPPDDAAARTLIARLAQDRPTCTSLEGGLPSAGIAVALYASSQVSRPALVVDGRALADSAAASRVAAEALLREAVVLVTGDTSGIPPWRWETLTTTVVIGAHPVLVDESSHDVGSLLLRPRPEATVGTHLVDVLRGRGLEVAPAEAERMGRWEHLRYEDVGHLANTLRARATVRGHGGKGPTITAEDVAEVSAGVVGQQLARLATPLATSRSWDHLVLLPGLRRELDELVTQAAGRAQVLDESGFSRLPGQPRGVTAVFAGPSGTGKTLAARLVAGALGLPLYAVNLAATVSKYIGETERNLDAVFGAADQSDAVLLFDEAESLFGKRSEVQDAHDRYANLEISFLLQRMERYEGVAILATNLLGHFDDAFARRLSFCLHFPYPDENQRSLIWREVWPEQVVLDPELDLDEIAARHPLSGGHIRNIAIASTHLARARRGVVDAVCLHRAIDREYAKLGQVPDPLPEAVA